MKPTRVDVQRKVARWKRLKERQLRAAVELQTVMLRNARTELAELRNAGADDLLVKFMAQDEDAIQELFEAEDAERDEIVWALACYLGDMARSKGQFAAALGLLIAHQLGAFYSHGRPIFSRIFSLFC